MCGSCCENKGNKRQSDMRIKKRKQSTHLSGGAGIPPEPQLTQAQQKTRQHGKEAERRFNAGTTSLVSSSSILLKCRPLACTQEEKWNSIFFCSKPHPRYLSVSAKTMQHANCLSAGRFIHRRLENGSDQLVFPFALACIVLAA